MAQIHGRNLKLHIDDVSAASQDFTGDFNNITFSWTRDNPDVTTFGKDTIQRMAGLRDATLSYSGIFNTGTVTAACVIGGLMNGSALTRVRWFPAGSTTGCMFWTGCFLVSKYEEVGPVNGPMAINMEMQMASGSVSASTV